MRKWLFSFAVLCFVGLVLLGLKYGLNGKGVRIGGGYLSQPQTMLRSVPGFDFNSQTSEIPLLIQIMSKEFDLDTDKNIQDTDKIVQTGYYNAPIVIRKYNLLFFSIPEVACSAFKMLFRRMEGYDDWLTHEHNNPLTDGLEYLHQVPRNEAEEMLTSPNWTRAVFLREPKERLLSTYLDKGVKDGFIQKKCCDSLIKDVVDREICLSEVSNFAGFVQKAKTCTDDHWSEQSKRLSFRHWKYVNFVGHYEKVAVDTEKLLRKLGWNAWDNYGKSGWGRHGNESMFSASASTTNATDLELRLSDYYTPELEKDVEDMYELDFKLLNFATH